MKFRPNCRHIDWQRRVCPSAVAAAIASIVLVQQAPAQPPAAVVVAAPVIEEEVATGQTFVGTVMPQTVAIVGSAVDGRVIEFPRNEGDRVERGEILAHLLTDTIELDVAAAEAELELRRHQLAELENGTRPEDIEQAKARMNAAEARMQYLNGRRARVEALFAKNRTLSEEERDEAVSAAVEAEQAYVEARHAYALAIAGPRAEQIAQARAQVAMAQAALNQLKDQLAKHSVTASFAGYVVAERTEVGQWVRQGDPIVELAAMDEVEVVTHVVEQFIPFAKVGTIVRVEVPALPDQEFTGEIAAVVPRADVQARTFPVKIRIKNELSADGPLLKSGMYARMKLATGRKHLAMLVPKDAIVLGGPSPLVYVVDADSSSSPPGGGPPSPPQAMGDSGGPAPQASPMPKTGTARPAPVQLGVAIGDKIQVSGPIKVGDLVVVRGNERLNPGQGVEVQRIIAHEAPSEPVSTLQPNQPPQGRLP